MTSFRRESARFRSWIWGLGAFGLAAALSAQSVATVGELLDGVIGPNAALPNYFVIPVAGHVIGYRGTEFSTDVTILAAAGTSQRVAVAWLAEGVDNSARPLDLLEVGPGPAFFPDMVLNALGKTGLGALVVAAITPDGSLDPTAKLRGFARVWTPVPGCAGTSSLAVESIRFIPGGGEATGLLLNTEHRGSVGLVNPNPHAVVFTGYFYSQPEISVPAASMVQVGIQITESSDPDRPADLYVNNVDGDLFAGYAVSVDQLSGDGWLVSFHVPTY